MTGYANRFSKNPLHTCGCGKVEPRRSHVQKYCVSCSEEAGLARGRKWARANTQPFDTIKHERQKRAEVDRRSRAVARSVAVRQSLTSSIPCADSHPDLAWYVRFEVPFSQAVSKNHVWSLAKGGGHIFKRKASNDYKNLIALKVKSLIARQGATVVVNKVWVDLFVQKQNHKSDAINALDLVADGLKEGLGVDDRWFSVRRIDWEIVKSDPKIFIGVGQESAFAARVCSLCGAIKGVDGFPFHSKAKQIRSRRCFECTAPQAKKFEAPETQSQQGELVP